MLANRRHVWRILLPVCLWLLGPQWVLAAAELPVLLAQQNGDGAPGPTIVFNRNSVFDYILVVLLFGAALFAICRSSHRN